MADWSTFRAPDSSIERSFKADLQQMRLCRNATPRPEIHASPEYRSLCPQVSAAGVLLW
jgi:hypothetical protein